jgi:hypothetical protein
MSPNHLNKSLLALGAVAAAIGGLDAVASQAWDLAVLFLVLTAVHVALAIRFHLRRPPIPLRADLVGWLRERAVATGEPIEVLADRCVATYRAELGERR